MKPIDALAHHAKLAANTIADSELGTTAERAAALQAVSEHASALATKRKRTPAMDAAAEAAKAEDAEKPEGKRRAAK